MAIICSYILLCLLSSAFGFLPKFVKPVVQKPLFAYDSDKCPGNVMTLTRFMIDATRNNRDHADLESLMSSIQLACKTISNLVSRSGIDNFTESSPNRIDIVANNILKNALRYTGKLGVVASDNEDGPVLIEEAYNSKYVAVFDPLDSYNDIDIGTSTGTIFGIFKENEFCLVDEDEDLSLEQQKCLLQTLQPGDNLVAAGYCMYSSSTVLVFSLGEGTHGFTLDPTIGEFVLTYPNIRIPTRGKIYSFNEGNAHKWHSGYRNYVSAIKSGKGESGEEYKSRYVGSMVGDVHRTLLYGGIFGYPADRDKPNGKLHLLYESAPISFLVEQAGGKAITGREREKGVKEEKGGERILDVVPSSVHERISTILGSLEDVNECQKFLEREREIINENAGEVKENKNKKTEREKENILNKTIISKGIEKEKEKKKDKKIIKKSKTIVIRD